MSQSRTHAGWLAILYVVVPLFAVDLILPAMPRFGRDLGAGVATTQLALTVFAAGFALTHLVLGPVTDRYGRRPVLLFGLALFVVGSLACAVAPTIEALVGARIIQALGAGTAPLAARAVVRDVYDASGAGRMMGLIMACFGIGAITTPVIGGLVTDLFGWRAVFYTAALFGTGVLLLTFLLLPETRPPPAPGAPAPNYWRTYRTLACDRRFIVVTVAGCSVASGMFCWISGSSFVVQNVFGQSAMAYSAVYAVTIVGFVAMSLYSARLAPRYGSYRVLGFGVALAAIGGLVGLAMGLAVEPTLLLVMGAMTIMAMGHGFNLPQSMAASIAPFPHLAGSASALFGFIQYGINTIVTVLNGLLYDGTAFPMLALVAAFTCAGATIYFALGPRPTRIAS